MELDAAVYAIDASTIDLCLSVFAWAPFRSTKAAINLHTLLDLRGNIPRFVHIADGKTHEVNVMDDLVLEPGAFYLMDRGYLDFARLFVIHEAKAFFVTHSKNNTKFKQRYSHPVDRINTTVLCDQTGVLSGYLAGKDDLAPMRQIELLRRGSWACCEIGDSGYLSHSIKPFLGKIWGRVNDWNS